MIISRPGLHREGRILLRVHSHSAQKVLVHCHMLFHDLDRMIEIAASGISWSAYYRNIPATPLQRVGCSLGAACRKEHFVGPIYGSERLRRALRPSCGPLASATAQEWPFSGHYKPRRGDYPRQGSILPRGRGIDTKRGAFSRHCNLPPAPWFSEYALSETHVLPMLLLPDFDSLNLENNV